MIRIYLCILLIALLNSRPAMAETTLLRLAKADSKDVVQIYLTVDSPPEFSYRRTGKRLDIILEDTIYSSELQLFEADDRIIKLLPHSAENKTIISVFFRYPPQDVEVSSSADGKIVAEILLGNRYSRSYEDLSQKLKGLTIVEPEPVTITSPLKDCPYAGDWEKFIHEYEADIRISVPLRFSLPPFPAISLIPPAKEQNALLLNNEVAELAENGLWDDIQLIILEQIRSTNIVEDQKMLALTLGEILLRKNDFEGAYKQLYLLGQKYHNEHIGIIANYLQALLEARFDNPYLADFELGKLQKLITPNNPLAPYFLISRIETALATDQFDKAKLLLNIDNVPFPDQLLKIRQLRLGDYYNDSGKQLTSYVSYKLLEDRELLAEHPYSLNGFCNSLYNQRNYQQAAACYRDLQQHVSDNKNLGLISYRKSMSELHIRPPGEVMDNFSRIEDAFPDTEAGSLAGIKYTDLQYLHNSGLAIEAAQAYHNLAETTVARSAAAEAWVKEALMFKLSGNSKKSVELLMDFLREFRLSKLRDVATAMLIDTLPRELERCIDNNEYMNALILAKQNRDLFLNDWLDASLLAGIADAYQKVGIFSEAQKVYSYLIEIEDVDSREQFFLPLINSVYNQGEYELVEDISAQYLYNYPEGEDNQEILVLRLKALMATDKFSQAESLLTQADEDNFEARRLAVAIHYHFNSYEKIIETLAQTGVENLPEDTLYMLAESRFHLDRSDKGESCYTILSEDDRFREPSLYRLALLARERGEEQMALKFLASIVEKEGSSFYHKFAEKELEFAEITHSIEDMLNK